MTPEPASVIADLAARRAQAEEQAGGVRFEAPASGKGAPRLVLPATPAAEDTAGQARWLTAVFNLHPAHPVTGAARQGRSAGHVVLRRHDAPPIRFEPASRLNTPARLVEDLEDHKQAYDPETYGLKTEHTRQIVHVVRMLCGAQQGISDQEETASIVGVYLQGAQAVEGHGTYGTGSARYEAAAALQRDLDDRGLPCTPPRYLVDRDTGELVVRVQDLGDVARRHIGSSIARGWLDARMIDLGWQRVRLDGHALPGREGRSGPHLRVDVFRGHLPAAEPRVGGHAITSGNAPSVTT